MVCLSASRSRDQRVLFLHVCSPVWFVSFSPVLINKTTCSIPLFLFAAQTPGLGIVPFQKPCNPQARTCKSRIISRAHYFRLGVVDSFFFFFFFFFCSGFWALVIGKDQPPAVVAFLHRRVLSGPIISGTYPHTVIATLSSVATIVLDSSKTL